MSKHTPGPWRAIPGDDNEQGVTAHIAIFGDGWYIARVWGDAINPDADARLIAAAPELLGALKILRPYLEEDAGLCICEPYRRAIEQALAAIAKTEGHE